MCRHGRPVDDFCIDIFETAREAVPATQRHPSDKVPTDGPGMREASGKGWKAIMFTIDELATIPLFSALEEKALEYLAGEVEDIHLTPGEYVAHEGEGRALAVVVEGKTELTKLVNGVEQVIGVRLPGELGGEIPMTLGTPLPASMRAVEPSRVMKLTVEVFHTLAAMAPEVSTTVGAAALERMEMLKNATAQPLEPALFIIGPRVDPGVHGCDSFLHRNQIPYERLEPDAPAAVALVGGEARRTRPLSGSGAARRHSAD